MSHHIRLFLGASSPIGRHMAELYAAQGDSIIFAGRTPDSMLETVQHLKLKYHVDVHNIAYDAANSALHAALVQEILGLCAGKTLHVIAMTGIMPEQSDMDKDVALMERCIQVNFTGILSVLHPLADYLETQKEGSVIIISSVAGERGRLSNYIYSATKAALTAYASGLRNRLGRSGVHVLTVKPGLIHTPMTKNMPLPPLPVAQPEQVALDIVKAHQKQRNVLYTPLFWLPIMTIVKLIPEFIFKKMKF